MKSGSKRFRVALSFPGEHRPFLEKVAARLATELGRDRVLYDAYHEAEFARPNLDTHLQGLYHDQSDLIAVFFCEDYERKEWCGLEWRAIRDLIRKREDETVMPLRFDMAEIPGIFSIDGYSWIGDRTPVQVAELILQRLRLRGATADPPPPASRRVAPSRLTHSADRLFGRDKELAALDAAWADPATHVVTLVAWGGVGKTSLVARWAAGLAARDYDGAGYFDWSFYSQGTREAGGASADPFVDAALRFFGDEAMADSARSPWDKGARLAHLVAERRTLLVLDGLEPLQHPPGPLAGDLKDPAVAALLRGLAARNAGLCVVTTQVRVESLIAFEESTAPRWELADLSTPAGVALLKSVSVFGSDSDLIILVDDVKGHALTLNLIGRFLAKAHGGDVRRRDQVDLLKADRKKQAFCVMAAYETWLATGAEHGRRQLAILRLIGLFDRSAEPGCLEALRNGPAIAGLTEPLPNLDEDEDWNIAVGDLADCGLISRPPLGSALDAHPLIREHFARQLREQNPDASKAGHSLLFDYLTDLAEPGPQTLAGLQPLYQAVFHGCRAGRHAETFQEVYLNRIQGRDTFAWKKLGAMSSNLGALSCFFEQPWTKIHPSLSPKSQGYVLNDSALCLCAQGRLIDALGAYRGALAIAEATSEWEDACAAAINLSELSLVLGDGARAHELAESAVARALRCSDKFWMMVSCSNLGTVFYYIGREKDTGLAQFQRAERFQAELYPQFPQLTSLRGFRYCEMQLHDVELAAFREKPDADGLRVCKEVEVRALRSQRIPAVEKSLLDVALDHLTLGRSRLYRAILSSSSLEAAKVDIEQAVDGLRASAQIQYLPLGLLTRAWLRSAQGDADGARADLAEAQEIAERGPMPFYFADVHLYRARLFSDRDALTEARRLVKEHGYGRRLGDLEDLEDLEARL